MKDNKDTRVKEAFMTAFAVVILGAIWLPLGMAMGFLIIHHDIK